jgi:hypothetical protein
MKAPALLPLLLKEVYTDKNGKLFDADTGLPINLASEARLRLLLDPSYLLAPPAPFKPIVRQILEPGNKLYFNLNKTHWGKVSVVVRFPKGLIMHQIEAPDLPCCPEEVECVIEAVNISANPWSPPDFQEIKATSLNQAYFQASKRYEPSRKSHSTDAYHTFRTEDGELLRDVWKNSKNV